MTTLFSIDTEFNENGHTIDLISIGVVASKNGRVVDRFYRISGEFNPETCNEWVKENVLPKLGNQARSSREAIKHELLDFVRRNCDAELNEETPEMDRPVFIGYYADYDWVAVCQLFGPMINLPKGWPMYCVDLKQMMWMYGVTDKPEQTGEHNALADAEWNLRLLASLEGRMMVWPYIDYLEREKYTWERRAAGEIGVLLNDNTYCFSFEDEIVSRELQGSSLRMRVAFTSRSISVKELYRRLNIRLRGGESLYLVNADGTKSVLVHQDEAFGEFMSDRTIQLGVIGNHLYPLPRLVIDKTERRLEL